MAFIRRSLDLQGMAESSRPEFLLDLRNRCQQALDELHAGCERRYAWNLASCVGKNASSQVRANCRSARLSVSKGPKWGFILAIEPQDMRLNSVELSFNPAVPRVLKLQEWSLAGAVLAGLAAGLPSFIVTLMDTGKPRHSLSVGIAVCAAVALGLGFAISLLLLPMRLAAARSMKKDIGVASIRIEEVLAEIQAGLSGISSAKSARPPTFKWGAGLLASLALCGVAYLGGFHSSLGEGIRMASMGLMFVAGLGAFCALIGFLTAAFGLAD